MSCEGMLAGDPLQGRACRGDVSPCLGPPPRAYGGKASTGHEGCVSGTDPALTPASQAGQSADHPSQGGECSLTGWLYRS